jgi:hypothetical protein
LHTALTDVDTVSIVVYLLNARTVEPQKTRNTVHYATIDEAVFPPSRAVPSRTAFVATERCEKNISAAANQHTTVKKAIFSTLPALTSQQWLGVT